MHRRTLVFLVLVVVIVVALGPPSRASTNRVIIPGGRRAPGMGLGCLVLVDQRTPGVAGGHGRAGHED